MDKTVETKAAQVITAAELLAHWQGHRTLTRKVIEALPEEAFFSYSLGGMRPFSDMVLELLAIAGPGVNGIVTGQWEELKEHIDHGNSKENILQLWDQSTLDINAYWEQIPVERFHDAIRSFGQYEGTVWSTILYFIENEIHHRGQGYVYLRSLHIEPPYFWEQ